MLTSDSDSCAHDRPWLAQMLVHDPCEQPSALGADLNQAPVQPVCEEAARMSTLQGSEQLCGNTRGTVVQPGAQGVQTPCSSATCPMAHTTPCTQSCGDEDALKDENPAGHDVQLSLCGALKVPMGQAVQAVAPATE